MSPDQSSSGGLSNTEYPRRGWQSIFSALQITTFRKFWLSLMVLNFAVQLQSPAQSWLAYQLTGSPLKLTLVAAMQSIPMFLLSLYSGVIIDRIPKRNVIVITQIITALVSAAIAVLILTDRIQYWHLLASSFIAGINGAFNMTARNAIMADLVPRDKLYNAIALNNVASNAAGILGPAISGILIGLIGTEGAYFTGIGFYIAGIIMLCLLPAIAGQARLLSGPMIRNLKLGLAYLKTQKLLVILFMMELALTLFGVIYSGLIPVFADLWGLKSEGYGFLLAASGIGSMLGSLAIASLGNYKHKGRLILISGISLGIVLVLFANTGLISSFLHISPLTFYIACLFLILVGLFSTTYATTSNTTIQMSITDEFRGRVNGVYSMIVALYPLATLGLGALAEAIGASLALSICAGILIMIMGAVMIFMRPVRRME